MNIFKFFKKNKKSYPLRGRRLIPVYQGGQRLGWLVADKRGGEYYGK